MTPADPVQPHPSQHRLDARRALLALDPTGGEAEGEVALDGEVRPEREVLEDDGEVPLLGRDDHAAVVRDGAPPRLTRPPGTARPSTARRRRSSGGRGPGRARFPSGSSRESDLVEDAVGPYESETRSRAIPVTPIPGAGSRRPPPPRREATDEARRRRAARAVGLSVKIRTVAARRREGSRGRPSRGRAGRKAKGEARRSRCRGRGGHEDPAQPARVAGARHGRGFLEVRRGLRDESADRPDAQDGVARHVAHDEDAGAGVDPLQPRPVPEAHDPHPEERGGRHEREDRRGVEEGRAGEPPCRGVADEGRSPRRPSPRPPPT
jgi:hypothetical protein